MTYIKNPKKISVKLENCIKDLFNKFNLYPILNHSRGIDLIFNHKKIEIKSCFYYRYRNQNSKYLRIGVFKLKTSELNITDFYIFIQINNKTTNINFIHSYNIYIIDSIEINKYVNKKAKNLLLDKICISVKELKNIRKVNLIDFLYIFEKIFK